jgi:hypothetical protein
MEQAMEAIIGRCALTLTKWAGIGTIATIRATWRLLLPAYWALAAWCIAVAVHLGAAPQSLAAWAAAGATGCAGLWPARSHVVRAWRAATAIAYGVWALVATPIGHGPAVTVLVVITIVAGWPWWHHISQPAREPQVMDLGRWATLWQTEVVAHDLCKRTALVDVHETDRIVRGTVRLLPGASIARVTRDSQAVETALQTDVGGIGWEATGKAHRLGLIIVRKSAITRPVLYSGPTYQRGKLQVATYADGSPGWWTHLTEGSGACNGLIVGSMGTGKTRAVGVIIHDLLQAGVQVVIGDPQGGQSLPAWRDTVEYHADPEPVTRLLERVHAEVAERSRLMAEQYAEAYDVNDPRIIELGIKPLAVIINECHLVLDGESREGRKIVKTVEKLAAICRKTGVSLIMETQIPQLGSLGGSQKLRDALVAGNCLVLRLSNRQSKASILPDDFCGDPYSIPAEIDGRTTAGVGYLRNASRLGMLARVPLLNEAKAAASHTQRPVDWHVPEADAQDDTSETATPATQRIPAGVPARSGDIDRMAALFAASTRRPARTATKPRSTIDWVVACLTAAPQSVRALLARDDCPVSQPQLYATLAQLRDAGRLIAPKQRGGTWRTPDARR